MKIVGFISVISAICLLLFNYVLIPNFGKEGAALSICFSQLIVPIYMFYKSQSLYYIPFNFKKGISIILFLIIISALGLMVKGQWWELVLYKLLFLVIVFYFFYYQSKEDIFKMLNIVKEKLPLGKILKKDNDI